MIWFILACLISIGLIFWGVLTRAEPTGLDYITKWPRFSLPIGITFSLNREQYSPSLLTATNKAVTWWNREAKIPLFAPLGTDRGPYVIGIYQDLPNDHENAGEAEIVHHKGEILSVRIRVKREFSAYSKERQWILIAHELGHAIGLAHDPNLWSIMHASAKRRAVLTKADRDFLREKYGG